ncbi:MAG: hypothetical protein JSS79_10870 [Bacteroidetes bacterium]|nr:hypothetical protein [Bacteroidota bacterium]
MRQFFFAVAILTLLYSCSSNSKTENSNASKDSTNSLTREEKEYLTKRNIYIGQIQTIQWKIGPGGNYDSIGKVEKQAMSTLENLLKEALKTSRFSGEGYINLETLFAAMEFGMLDGLSVSKDSTTRVVYTTRNLFISYLEDNKMENPLEKLNPDAFAKVSEKHLQMMHESKIIHL